MPDAPIAAPVSTPSPAPVSPSSTVTQVSTPSAAASTPSTTTSTSTAAAATTTAATIATGSAAAAHESAAESPAAGGSSDVAQPDGAAAAAVDRPSRPERAAYGDDIEKFLRDTYAWEEANPVGTALVTGEEVPVEGDRPAAEAEAPAAEAAKTEEATKPIEVEAPTPQALQEILTADPALAAAIEANPTAKGKLFQMARSVAKAAPVLEIFPNVEAARFANEHANQFVGLKTAFQLSDSPEKMKDAAGMFLEQFAVTDDKGQPVLDVAGNPTYGEDLPLFVQEIKGRDTAVRIQDIKDRIAAGEYATPEGRETDEHLLAAYEFIAAAEAAGPQQLDRPDPAQMTPEAKAYFDKRERELAEEKERLGIKDKALTERQRVETRTKYDQQYREQFGASSGRFLSNYLQQKEKDGVAIPRYMLTMKDPKTGVSVFAQQAFQKLNEKLNTLPSVKAHSATLQMNALNDQALGARLTYGQSLIDEHLPGIVDALLNEAGVSLAEDARQKIAGREARRGDARVEPAAGSMVTPRNMSEAQIYDMAKANVAKKNAGRYLDPAEAMRQNLIERDRLLAQR